MQAIFSDCGLFRYSIWDVWDDTKPMLAWCLHNPSQAGKEVGGKRIPDPTWTKGVGFSKRLGYGGQVFCNPFAFISTEPAGLKKAGYPIGPENDAHILRACAMGDGKVVCAWGALGRKLSRHVEVMAMIRKAGYRPHALGFTADGLPRHPLMLAYDTPLVEIEEPVMVKVG
jgi:hypothetical protein